MNNDTESFEFNSLNINLLVLKFGNFNELSIKNNAFVSYALAVVEFWGKVAIATPKRMELPGALLLVTHCREQNEGFLMNRSPDSEND
ncbi:MAG: hypothetical protein P8179_22855 [Candidatus Thiodiazotropha sp.]